jgi:hypothetical protein
MDALLPIIRRKRRPLLPVDPLPVAPVVANNAEPKQGVTPLSQENLPGKKGNSTKPTDDEVA